MPSRPTLDLSRVPPLYRSRRTTESLAIQAADARINISQALGGYSLGSALAVMAKDSVFYDPESLLEYLRPGVTVRVRCATHARGTWRNHKVTINPDGTIDAHDHPADTYLEGEFLLGALADFMPACLMIAHVVPQHLSTPKFYSAGRQSLDSRFRPLYAAVMWAQDPDADWSMIRDLDLLRLHVTPDVMGRWHEAGFTTAQAVPFWATGAALAQSLPWLEAGKTDKRAARLALDGALPDSDSAWVAAGFSPSAAQGWRRSTNLSPVEAFVWHRRGFTLTAYKNLQNPRRGQERLDPATMFAWADAGLHGADVERWYRVTGADLDTALYWSVAGIRPGSLHALVCPSAPPAFNATTGMSGPVVPTADGITREQIGQWAQAGFPITEGDLLAMVHRSDITPRWWSLEVAQNPAAMSVRHATYTLIRRMLNL